jgi:hypothetical protein
MESMGVASIMEITEFDVSQGKLITRTLSAEEEAEIMAIQNAGLKVFNYNVEDSYQDKFNMLVSQYESAGYAKEEAESTARLIIGEN